MISLPLKSQCSCRNQQSKVTQRTCKHARWTTDVREIAFYEWRAKCTLMKSYFLDIYTLILASTENNFNSNRSFLILLFSVSVNNLFFILQIDSDNDARSGNDAKCLEIFNAFSVDRIRFSQRCRRRFFRLANIWTTVNVPLCRSVHFSSVVFCLRKIRHKRVRSWKQIAHGWQIWIWLMKNERSLPINVATPKNSITTKILRLIFLLRSLFFVALKCPDE